MFFFLSAPRQREEFYFELFACKIAAEGKKSHTHQIESKETKQPKTKTIKHDPEIKKIKIGK